MQSDITPSEYTAFKNFLESACGILLGDNKQYLVKSRLRKICDESQIPSLGELMLRLNKQPRSGLRETVIDAMTTNETLWFRDTHPYRILADKLLMELTEKGGPSQIKIWSAACSTGQEPYSMMMVVDEFKKQKLGRLRGDVRITATDISKSVLEQARKGEYEMLAIGRGLSPERQKAYFSKSTAGSWVVNPELKRNIDFRELNLLERYVIGKFDIIFCRNVLIYFSAELKKDILTRMHAALNPGGYLVLGASESLNGLQDKFDMVQCSPGIIYKAK